MTISPYFLLLFPCAVIFQQHYNVFRKEEEAVSRASNVDSRLGTVGTRMTDKDEEPDLSAEFDQGSFVEEMSKVDVEEYDEKKDFEFDPNIMMSMNGLIPQINVAELKGKPAFSRQTYAPSTQASLLDIDK